MEFESHFYILLCTSSSIYTVRWLFYLIRKIFAIYMFSFDYRISLNEPRKRKIKGLYNLKYKIQRKMLHKRQYIFIFIPIYIFGDITACSQKLYRIILHFDITSHDRSWIITHKPIFIIRGCYNRSHHYISVMLAYSISLF